MKTEDPQHLESNDLGQVVQAVGSRVQANGTQIAAIVCVVLIVCASFAVWSRQSTSANVEASRLLESAETVGDFADIATKYKHLAIGKWAKLRESEMYLGSGLSVMFSDRELAESDLKRAKEGFSSLVDDKSLDAAIRERTLWGMAMTLESTSNGDTTAAVDAYSKLLNEIPETIYKAVAEQRVKELKSESAKDFYSWFAKQRPKPGEVRPNDGAVKGDESSNTIPDLFKPEPPENKDAKKAESNETKQDETKAPAETKKDEPAESGEKADDKPKSEPTNEAKPATPENKEASDKN